LRTADGDAFQSEEICDTDLFLNAIEAGNDLLLNCDYNTDLIDQTTLQRWLASYKTILPGLRRMRAAVWKSWRFWKRANVAW